MRSFLKELNRINKLVKAFSFNIKLIRATHKFHRLLGSKIGKKQLLLKVSTSKGRFK